MILLNNMEIIKKEIKYPYLPIERSILYVPISNKYMILAKQQARKSNDHNTPTGVVVVFNDKVISSAYNNPHISNNFLINLHTRFCIRKLLKIPSGTNYWICPGCATNSSHAEYRAVLEVQRKMLKEYNDLDIYLWGHWWCCKPCWDKMLELPLRNIYLLENSEILFNPKHPGNIIGKQFKL
jgi:deoxycytidylate deaminase